MADRNLLTYYLAAAMQKKGEKSMAKIKPVRIKETEYGTYSLHFTNPSGKMRRISAGPDYQHAQRLASQFFNWLVEAKDPEFELEKMQKLKTDRSITLRDFYPIFLKRHGIHQSKNMRSSYHYCYKNICRCIKFVDTPIEWITIGDTLDYLNLRLENDGVCYATVNKEASFIRGMLSRAVEWGTLENNPLQRLRMFRESEKRRVDLTPEQAFELINLLPEPHAKIVEFAIYSGFRKENILSLQIEQIRFHDLTPTGEVKLIVKGGRKETFPIGEYAVEVLKKVIGKRKKGFVFLNPKTQTRYVSIHKCFNVVVRRLNLTVNGTKLRFHDLRHVFCTWLLKQGVSIDVIRELAGHRNRATTDRYATLNRLKLSKYLSYLPEIKSSNRLDAEAS